MSQETLRIENAKFEVGDNVRLKGASKASEEQKKFLKTMVIAEMWEEKNFAKKCFEYDSNGMPKARIKDVGSFIKVKCIWFYGGQVKQHVFWESVLEKV